MFLHKTPKLVRWLYPKLIWSVNTKEKKLYLTFDDGPIPGLTEFVIRTLDNFEAKATFFCVGDNLKKYPDIAQLAFDKGHTLANHTFNHIKGWSTDTSKYLENIRKCDAQLSRYENKATTLFRPPYGKIKRNQISALERSYKIIMWDVLSGDYSQRIEPEQCLRNSIQATETGSIVLFHDNIKAQKNIEYTLPRYLEHFKKRDYHFLAL